MSVSIERHPVSWRVAVFVPLVQAVVHTIVLDEALHLEATLSLDSYDVCVHLRESPVAHDLKDVLRNLLRSKILGSSLLPALPAPRTKYCLCQRHCNALQFIIISV